MTDAPKRHLVTIIDARETIAKSAFRDGVSFGGLIATAYALNVLMPPSGWLNAALGISWILWLLGKASKRSYSGDAKGARAFLDSLDGAA